MQGVQGNGHDLKKGARARRSARVLLGRIHRLRAEDDVHGAGR
jgi:hypothetical protein